jgi:formylglycine-generating enzyme required for sulfatase activity
LENERTKNNKMKKLLGLLVLLPLLYACPSIEGNLVGVKDRDVFDPDILGAGNERLPYGMVYVKSGGYQSGVDDEDIMGVFTAQKKTVSVQAFYMDATEISNNEYRQFVHWVRDSIAREKLYRRNFGEDADQWVNVPDNFFKEPYRTLLDMGSDVQGGNTPFQLFMDSTYNSEVDKTVLLLMGDKKPANATNTGAAGRGGAGRGGAAKPINLINGTITRPSAPAQGSKKDVELTFNDKELQSIFENYTSKAAATAGRGASRQTQNTGPNQGGRVENRKYFTLNWEQEIDYKDEQTQFLLSDMFYSESERFYKRREIDTRLLFFDYYWIDYKEAARRGKIQTKSVDARKTYNYDTLNDPRLGKDDNFYKRSKREPLSKDYKTNDLHRSTLDARGERVWLDTTIFTVQNNDSSKFKNNDKNFYKTSLENPGQDLDLGFTNSKGQHNALRGHTDRSRFIIKERINVYPDTLCWVRDFTYSFHEPMTQNYFWNNAYDNYPVVGVTWNQAKAFSVWRTQIFHSWLISNEELYVNDFRLPTESEWERAARGDLAISQYPWGGPYIRNNSGCFLANFKPLRGRYFEDGGFHTVKVYSYNPNGFGLYCMAGNVAEWCSSAFDESQYEFGHDMNSDYDYQAKDGDPPVKKRKVIRGGSWKDIGYYLMNGTRTYEYQDTAKSYIGFRNVMTHLGRGGSELDQENGEEIQSDIQLK